MSKFMPLYFHTTIRLCSLNAVAIYVDAGLKHKP
jgi:hypothetical protein